MAQVDGRALARNPLSQGGGEVSCQRFFEKWTLGIIIADLHRVIFSGAGRDNKAVAVE